MRLKIIDNNVFETCTVCVVNTMQELVNRVLQYIEDSEGCCDLHVFQWDENGSRGSHLHKQQKQLK